MFSNFGLKTSPFWILLNSLGRVVQSWVKIELGVRVKFDLRSESLKSKFSLFLFDYNLILEVPCNKGSESKKKGGGEVSFNCQRPLQYILTRISSYLFVFHETRGGGRGEG